MRIIAKKSFQQQSVAWFVVVALVGGVAGFLIGKSNQPYFGAAGSMMRTNGSTMIEMGQMMMGGGHKHS